MAKVLTQCPVCASALGVSELTCGRCKTRIGGSFETCRFCRLAPEPLAFIETFLRCEGNLSRVEKELGVSYPTVRNRLAGALSALGFGSDAAPAPPAPNAGWGEPPTPSAPDSTWESASERRLRVLDALATGDMTAEDAAAALRDLS